MSRFLTIIAKQLHEKWTIMIAVAGFWKLVTGVIGCRAEGG
jgi:hypothetical protein